MESASMADATLEIGNRNEKVADGKVIRQRILPRGFSESL